MTTDTQTTGIKNADEIITLARAYNLTVTIETTDRDNLTHHVVRIAIPVPAAYANTELGRAIASDTLTMLWTKPNRKGTRGRLEDATSFGAVISRKLRTLSAVTATIDTMGRSSRKYARDTSPTPDDVVDAPHALYIDGELRQEGIPAARVRSIVNNRRFTGRLTHQDDDNAIVCDTRRYVPAPLAPGKHTRTVNGGTPSLIDTEKALAEISNAQMLPGKRAVREMSAARSSARIEYRDNRGVVELRPATAEEAAQWKPEAERYTPGDRVIVRPVVYNPETRTHKVLPEYTGTVVNWSSPHYNVRAEEADEHGHGVRPCRAHELRPAAADHLRASELAARWWEGQHTEEPTDEALRAAFANYVKPKPPHPELYPAIRDAIANQTPPAAAAPLFTALAAYQAVSGASLSETPSDLHTLTRHLETLPLAAPVALHPELHAARDAVRCAWEDLCLAKGITSRTAARNKARAAIEQARTAVLAVAPHAERMRGTNIPATADEIRAATRAYNAVDSTHGELVAIETGTPCIRVSCRSIGPTGAHILARIAAGVDSPLGHIEAHPPLVLRFPRYDGRQDPIANARKVVTAKRLRVEVPVTFHNDRQI